ARARRVIVPNRSSPTGLVSAKGSQPRATSSSKRTRRGTAPDRKVFLVHKVCCPPPVGERRVPSHAYRGSPDTCRRVPRIPSRDDQSGPARASSSATHVAHSEGRIASDIDPLRASASLSL